VTGQRSDADGRRKLWPAFTPGLYEALPGPTCTSGWNEGCTDVARLGAEIRHHGYGSQEAGAPEMSTIADKAKKALERPLPAWTEGTTRFADFRDGPEDACPRPRALDPTGEDPMKNPSTSVWKLVAILK
jgi:hypothetical protein